MTEIPEIAVSQGSLSSYYYFDYFLENKAQFL